MADWRDSRYKRVLATLIPLVGYPLVALLGATFRWKADGGDEAGLEALRRRPSPIVHSAEFTSGP